MAHYQDGLQDGLMKGLALGAILGVMNGVNPLQAAVAGGLIGTGMDMMHNDYGHMGHYPVRYPQYGSPFLGGGYGHHGSPYGFGPYGLGFGGANCPLMMSSFNSSTMFPGGSHVSFGSISTGSGYSPWGGTHTHVSNRVQVASTPLGTHIRQRTSVITV